MDYGDTITLVDNAGDEHDYEYLGRVGYEGGVYAVLGEGAYDDNGNAIIGEDGEQEVEIDIFRVVEADNEEEYTEVEDLELIERVFALWCSGDGFGDDE